MSSASEQFAGLAGFLSNKTDMRLFWKIFLTLISALLLTALASGWLSKSWLLDQHEVEAQVDILEHQGEVAADLYTIEGTRAYRRWLGKVMHRHHFVGFLFNDAGKHVLHRPAPPEIKPLLKRLMQGERKLNIIRPPHVIWANRIDTNDRTMYWIATTRLPPQILQQTQRTKMLIYLFIALLILFVASLLISRMIALPVQQLRRITHQLGQGNLEVRPADELKGRGDEIGQLARDFGTMAEQIDSLLSSHKQLLRDISHELRSPLARLHVALELARSDEKPNRDELDRIEIEAGRINDLIEEVLTLARFDQGGIQLHADAIDLKALLQGLCTDLRFEAEAKTASVRLEASESIHIQGDGLWLARAIENVARNAIRYTACGSVVAISLIRQQHHAILTIRDHGPGVDEDKIVHLFEPFYRVSEERERQSGGYGLGLAIASQVVSAHHGTINAANHPDGGLVITLTLPLT